MPRLRETVGCARRMSGYRLAKVRTLLCAVAMTTACGGLSNEGELAEEDGPGAPVLVPQVARYPEVTSGPGTIAEGVASLNRYRELAGLSPVALDEGASTGCLGHLQYLAWESDHVHEGACNLRHDEPDAANPYRSDANEAWGMGALLACDRTPSSRLSLAHAVDRWINSLYHRLPVLDPGLSSVGAAELDGFVCLHFATGTSDIASPSRVLWPPADTVDVPRAFVGRENPCPSTPASPDATNPLNCPTSGFIVTATWFGPSKGYPFADKAPIAGLFDTRTGEAVPLLAWYADGVAGHDPLPGLVGQTVALVPAEPLAPGARYRVEMGEPGSEESWTFRTGDRSE